ncbi:hypothetical protein [Lunatimonas sp.]
METSIELMVITPWFPEAAQLLRNDIQLGEAGIWKRSLPAYS